MRASLAVLIGLFANALAVSAAEPNQLTPDEVAEGWISLFDGETLFGWTPTSKTDWKVADGAITVSGGDQGFLMTNSEFADYELHVEFKAPATTNSGIFLRTPLKPTDPARDCYELNIAPRENPFPTGSFVGRIKSDGIPRQSYPPPTLKTPPEKPVDPWDGRWHAFEVDADGPKFQVSIDGHPLHEYSDKSPILRGRIALQFREGPVAFRNIRLRPLSLKPMLNGRDLTGWRTDDVEASNFEVADNGELHVTNGRGELESGASYGDFVMQLDCFVDGDNLNSGIFFRCIPGEYTQGYESQIHNGYQDGDPTKPTDFGTGGIYRRVPARRVVSRDREWFTKTIVATGPHIAVWVDGYQATDWTDTRPPSDNPREGLRTAPGTISIQGHDPTTKLRFRNLRIAELPEKIHHGGTEDTEKENK